MNRVRVLSWLATAAVVALVPWLVAAQKEAPKADKQKIAGWTLMPATEMKWAPMPGLEGATQCPLWGDPAKEAHRILYKWPAGTKAPLHTHTWGDRGLVVSGTLSLAVEGAPAKKLPAGSYFSLAAGTKHVTAVEGDQPVLLYVEREGPFDVVMVEEAGAKK